MSTTGHDDKYWILQKKKAFEQVLAPYDEQSKNLKVSLYNEKLKVKIKCIN